MSQQTQDSDSAEFGPNQWLVDALREQWQEDPSSVDPSWAEYFADSAVNAGSSRPSRDDSTSSEASTTTPAKAPEPAPEQNAPPA